MNHEHTRGRWFTHTGTRTRTATRTRTGFGDPAAPSGPFDRTRMRVRRWARQFARASARFWRLATQTVSPLGWFVLVVVGLGAVAGAAAGWVEGWFVAVVGTALLLISLPFLLGSRSYRTRLRLSHLHVVAGGAAHLAVDVQNTSARPQLPAMVELPVGDALRELTVPLLGPHQDTLLAVTVPTARRGVIPVGPLAIAKRDPLGLLRRVMTWRETHLLHVHPVTVPLPPNTAGLVRDLEGQASKRLTDADLSFHAVREYAAGDAMRHIHWKSTAKTGTLMVRQYEESQSARIAVLFDALRAEYASDDEFEMAVSVAASLSVQAVREGRERFVASTFFTGRTRPSVDGLEALPSRDAVQLLNAWAELGPCAEGAPIEFLARGLAESGRNLSIVILVTGSVPDLSRLRRAALAFAPDVQVLAVRCALHADPAVQRLDPLTIATVGALGDLAPLMLRGGR